MVNLRVGVADKFPNRRYGMQSPPTIYKDLVITGSSVGEFPALSAAGDVRAWEVRTGKLVWTFHTIPRPGEPNHDARQGEDWEDGGARTRGGSSLSMSSAGWGSCQ
jgi:quinoprotein glucose dehydrogenase